VQTQTALEVLQATGGLGKDVKVHPGPDQSQNPGPDLEGPTMPRIHQKIKNVVEVLRGPGQDPDLGPEKMIKKRYPSRNLFQRRLNKKLHVKKSNKKDK
jgi:hypothetical protein